MWFCSRQLLSLFYYSSLPFLAMAGKAKAFIRRSKPLRIKQYELLQLKMICPILNLVYLSLELVMFHRNYYIHKRIIYLLEIESFENNVRLTLPRQTSLLDLLKSGVVLRRSLSIKYLNFVAITSFWDHKWTELHSGSNLTVKWKALMKEWHVDNHLRNIWTVWIWI